MGGGGKAAGAARVVILGNIVSVVKKVGQNSWSKLSIFSHHRLDYNLEGNFNRDLLNFVKKC